MAGQPPDGTWQSASVNGQDGPERVRLPWEPPRAQGWPYEQAQPGQPYGQPYEQPPPPYEQAAHEAYPPPRPQSYSQPGEPAYGGGDAQPDHHTLAWDQGGQGQGGPPGRGQAYHATRAASRAAAGRGKGYVASLFDFSFTSFVTPKVIKGLYVLGVAWTALWAILIFLIGVHLGHAVFSTIVFMLILDIVFVLLTLGVIRVILEFFMVQFRINENIQALRDRDDQS